jgi:DNA-binding XRE family transcriptional regulator
MYHISNDFFWNKNQKGVRTMDYTYKSGERQMLIEQQEAEMKQKVAERFAAYRKQKGMSQTELAERAGVSRTNITRFENGKYNPSVEMMVRIAMALDAELDITIGGMEI